MGLIVGLLLVILALVLTHSIWFDNPSDTTQRRMDIVGQLVVGIGTAALAIVTWASVYETQQVVSGEDTRFRQSRMPMIALGAVPDPVRGDDGKVYFKVPFHNAGDGPAQDIQVAIKGTVQLLWSTQRVRLEGGRKVSDPPIHAGDKEAKIGASFFAAGFFLRAGDSGDGLVPYPQLEFPRGSEDLIVVNQESRNNIEHVTIKYTDVFGEEFTTTHSRGQGKRFLLDFTLERPARYNP